MLGAIAGLRHYPDPQYRELCQALGDHHQIDPAWVLPGNGAAELLTWAARDFDRSLQATHPARAVYLLTPAFGDYQRALKAFDVPIQSWPILGADDEVTLSLGHKPGMPPGAAGLVVNNPHNPTGHLFSTCDLLPYLDQFDPVVVDEAFMDFVPPPQQQSLLPWVAGHPNLVILRSLTKFYTLPGLRLGYAIGHPDRLRRWQQWRDPWPVNGLAAAAAMAAVADHEFQTRTWRWLGPARQALFEGIQAIPGLSPLPGAANYLLVRSGRSVLELQVALLKPHQILIRDCLSFPELGEHYFRVAVRTPAENQRLLLGLRPIASED